MSDLFHLLVDSEIMSKEQVHLGFVRILESASDLSLDNPHANDLIQGFIQRAIAHGILKSDFGN